MKEVKEKISYSKLDLLFAYNEDIINGINDFCSSAKADWLVMSPEKPSLYERIIMLDYSVTRNMCFHTHTPLLAIPEYYNTDNSKFWEMFELDEKIFSENC